MSAPTPVVSAVKARLKSPEVHAIHYDGNADAVSKFGGWMSVYADVGATDDSLCVTGNVRAPFALKPGEWLVRSFTEHEHGIMYGMTDSAFRSAFEVIA